MFGETLRRTNITLSIEDQSLVKALQEILRSVNLGIPANPEKGAPGDVLAYSLWLDRRIDPEQKVSVVSAALPASTVILKTIEPLGLVAYPLPGVMLVGRREWVAATLENLPPQSKPGARPAHPPISIRWPTGTTAAAVLSQIEKDGDLKRPIGDDAIQTLPHDVWTAGSFDSIDPNLAVALVLAQFDQPRSTPPKSPFLQTYPAGPHAVAIRELLNDRDGRSAVRVSGNDLSIRTTAFNHIDAVAQLWTITPDKAGGNPGQGGTVSVFDLKILNKPAGDVLTQLAAAAGKPIRFEPDTESARTRLVSLDAVKQSLEQLAEVVADQVGLEVQWTEKEVLVKSPLKS